MNTKSGNNSITKLIVFVSILIPVLVGVLYYFIPNTENFNVDVSFLPKINVSINFTVSLLLILGLYFIKQKEKKKHQLTMLSAFGLSSLFLILYVVYHFFAESTKYGGEGTLKYIYFFILLTHIILAAVVTPFILFSFYYAKTNQISKHLKLSRITWPIWFYVSISGVVVYLLISPYY